MVDSLRSVGGGREYVAAVGETEAAWRGVGVLSCYSQPRRGVDSYGFALGHFRCVADQYACRVFFASEGGEAASI